MSITAKIEKVDQFHDQSTNEDLMDVQVSIKDGTRTKATKRMSFPLDTSTKEVEAAISKFASTFTKDKESAERQAGLEKARKNADDVSTKLTGKTLTISEDKGVTKKK